MKKCWISFWMAALLLGLSGCGGTASISGAAHPVEEGTASLSDAAHPVQEAAGEEPFLYRGTLIGMEDSGLLRLEQAEGTAYGDPQMEFLLTSESELSFEREELAEGVYLEVYANPQGEILRAQLYPAAEMVVFNGTVRSVERDGEGGHLLLTRDGSGEEVVFHYYEDTRFFFPREELKEGLPVSIFHSGMMTRSLPPQCNALEVREQVDSLQ